MTIVNATEAELRAVNEALKLAALLDDRAPAADRARIAAWGEQVHRHRLLPSDLLDAVQAFYDMPSDRALGIADLTAHARRIKRDRLDRNPPVHGTLPRLVDDTDMTLALVVGSVGEPSGEHHGEHGGDRLGRAKHMLQTCRGRAESLAAIREFWAAKHGGPASAAASRPAGRDFSTPIHAA